MFILLFISETLFDQDADCRSERIEAFTFAFASTDHEVPNSRPKLGGRQWQQRNNTGPPVHVLLLHQSPKRIYAIFSLNMNACKLLL